MAILTHEQWMEQPLPVYYVTLQCKQFTRVHAEMALKYADMQSQWVYWDGDKTFAFGTEGERAIFLFWLSDDPFDDIVGQIV